MAEDAPVQSTEASVETEEQSTRPADDNPGAAQDSTETTTSGANGVAAAEDTEADESAAPAADNEPASEDTKATTGDGAVETAQGAMAGEEATAAEAGGATAGSKKKEKRKSGAGVPEHKTKKLNKKKSMVNLHLDVKPGEYWWARMKGHPTWPSIVCDEEMLPESLLSKRPVSAARVDGSYRPDFEEGGKNARDRRYPIMFLGTNEFNWQPNTDMDKIDMDELKQTVKDGDQGKRSKALWEAYKVAAEEHDLAYFKKLLVSHEEAMKKDAEEKAEADAKKKAKKDKKSKDRVDDDGDVDMDEAEAPADEAEKKKQPSKKRKKGAESDGETEKPAKTPKTLKVKGPKTPAEDSATKSQKTPKFKTKAPKKSKTDSEEAVDPPKVEEAPISDKDRRAKQEKTVLYLRHRLQKGFLTREQAPKEDEMHAMDDYFNQLEAIQDLDGNIIKLTKIHKVLKGIDKLHEIPKEEQFKFKERSRKLLADWNSAIASAENAGETTSKPATNGVHETEKTGDKTPETAAAATEGANPTETAKDADTTEPAEAPVETETLGNDAKDEADVTMEDAKPTEPEIDNPKETETEETTGTGAETAAAETTATA
ncbi:hypothetical protein H2201_000846 [Coniosporium apollinis]|uniref:PWWP domain-containing protein n=1 Tax=Coniosporium apollinis TaxID=61459 RepID=A0ABQ9P396_9PEZI|nr:hypothetical protein H2201_000846 [Coniosporium apollinis]